MAQLVLLYFTVGLLTRTLIVDTLCGAERMFHRSQLRLPVTVQRNGNTGVRREGNMKTCS